ncbi:pyridoxamine 5'-phosphate oxidase family protein [Flagellimonas abyssi]|uniref:Pyridoxamine 5'-phosphate oxidase family protein n=1 Tax=Flagellimonas abyssi TaxID=2864871 RepID=A0ABS7EU88_9FLAO|nr:pyridoxamine 5'-phosphate oxidase family protein [Allomuricauda abyssi]MBW8201152.1 pyridoxamine 5'-phosphate oxidase family protein [Allomuricauda abyssi]
MGTKNLFSNEAKQKIKELAEDIDIAIMETNLGSKPSHTIPMSTKEVDDEGCIWFLSNKNSEHNSYLNSDKSIQLIYSKPSDMEFMTVYGHAFITTDRTVLEKYYGKSDDTWFDGVDDPNLTAIKVIPEDAHYWDTRHGKFASLLKMGIGALTGKKQDLGEEGDLELHSPK